MADPSQSTRKATGKGSLLLSPPASGFTFDTTSPRSIIVSSAPAKPGEKNTAVPQVTVRSSVRPTPSEPAAEKVVADIAEDLEVVDINSPSEPHTSIFQFSERPIHHPVLTTGLNPESNLVLMCPII